YLSVKSRYAFAGAKCDLMTIGRPLRRAVGTLAFDQLSDLAVVECDARYIGIVAIPNSGSRLGGISDLLAVRGPAEVVDGKTSVGELFGLFGVNVYNMQMAPLIVLINNSDVVVLP